LLGASTDPSGLNTVTASFLGEIVECILWGVNAVIFGLAMFVFFWNRKGKGTNPWLVGATFTLFTFATSHCWLEFASLYKGMFFNYFPTSESPENRAADIIWSLTDFVGQLVLIYRLYLIWNKNWYITILPVLMSLTSVGSAMAGIGIIALMSTGPSAYAPPAVIPLGDLAFCLPLGFQILVTGLIVGKIWSISHSADSSRSVYSRGSSKTSNAMGVLIESGFLVLFVQILFVVYFTKESPVQSLLYSSAAQIYALAPTLIIVRVGLVSAFSDGSFTKSLSSSSGFSRSYTSKVQLNQQVVSFSDRQTDDVEMGIHNGEDKVYQIASR